MGRIARAWKWRAWLGWGKFRRILLCWFIELHAESYRSLYLYSRDSPGKVFRYTILLVVLNDMVLGSCEFHVDYFAATQTCVSQTKVMAAFLSGEMKDTVQIHPAGAYGLYYYFLQPLCSWFDLLCFQFWSVSFLVRNDKPWTTVGQVSRAYGWRHVYCLYVYLIT